MLEVNGSFFDQVCVDFWALERMMVTSLVACIVHVVIALAIRILFFIS